MLTYWETLIATQSNIAVSDSYAALWGKKAQNNYTVETYTGALPVTLEGTVEGSLVSYKIWGNTGGVGVETVEGFKLPIVSSSETTNIYIGRVALGKDEYVDSESGKIYRWASITGLSEPLCGIGTYVDSLDLSTGVLTRRIKKLVLTGEENWILESVDSFYNASVIAGAMFTATVVCSHQVSVNTHHLVGVENVWVSRTGRLNFATNVISHTVDDFKSFLATQYAAGTPVTVWYVLAEPETSTISVPSGLTGTIEGYLIQDGTPAPENPIYPSANGVKQTDGTYTIENAYLTPTDPPVPLPEIPTFAGATTISYGGGTGAQPEKVELKYKVKR